MKPQYHDTPDVPDPETPSFAERIQGFYASLSTLRHEGLDALEEYFQPDVVFWDPFRSTRGIEALRVLFERWLDRYPTVGFTDFRCDGSGERFALTYHMHMRMVAGPVFTTPMASLIRCRDGKVAELRDFYDLGSGLLSPSPLLLRSYRRIVSALLL